MHSSILRLKAWRLATRFLLGRTAGSAVGENLYRDLEEDWKRPEVAEHIVDRRTIADAYVQRYSFGHDVPPYFPREFAFPSRVAYRLRDIVVAPASGLYRLPQGRALQQSIGSIPRFYRSGVVDMLRQPVPMSCDRPVVVFSPLDYYHLLWDALPQVVHARQSFPETCVLMPSHHPSLMDRILDLVGIPAEDRLVTSQPVLLHDAILVPRLPESGFVPLCDIKALRAALLSHLALNGSTPAEKIYISRSHSANRSIANEMQMERVLEARGFRIVHFEDLDFSLQLKTMHEAKCIVAPHGAGLSNLLVAQPGAAVLEIIFPSWFNACYAKLSLQLGLNYRFIRTVDHSECVFPIDDVVSAVNDMEGSFS